MRPSRRDHGARSREDSGEFLNRNLLGWLIMTTTNRRAPQHLTDAGRELWKKIAGDSELDEPALLILQTLCEQFDRMNEARALLKAEGIVVKDRFSQPKQHPACAIERDAAAAMMRAWRLLGYDQVGDAQPSLFT